MALRAVVGLVLAVPGSRVVRGSRCCRETFDYRDEIDHYDDPSNDYDNTVGTRERKVVRGGV